MAKARPRGAPAPGAHRHGPRRYGTEQGRGTVAVQQRFHPTTTSRQRGGDRVMTGPVAPWRSQAIVTLVTRVAAGVGLIGVAVYQASGQATVAAQVRWANWGVVGLVAVGVANGLWLLTVRRAVGARARSLFDELARVGTGLP